ncbi:hypothetical protein FcAc13_12015, partial [Frischella sp. Ac13]|nr:hypothetical protein [Frischella japonica]
YLENVPDWANNPLLDEINAVIRDIIALTPETKGRSGSVFLTSNKREVAWGERVGRRIF